MASGINQQQTFPDCSRDGATAVGIAKRLIEIERLASSSLARAKKRVSERIGVSIWTLERWWNGTDEPRTVLASTWSRLIEAYEIECARQRRFFDDELQRMEDLKGGANSYLASAAAFVAGDEGRGPSIDGGHQGSNQLDTGERAAPQGVMDEGALGSSVR